MASLVHGLCHLVRDERGAIRPALSGDPVPFDDLRHEALELHAFASPAEARAFTLGVEASDSNHVSAFQGTGGADRLCLLVRHDRMPRGGATPDEVVALVDHGGAKPLRTRLAWGWLKDEAARTTNKPHRWRTPTFSVVTDDEGGDPEVTGIRWGNGSIGTLKARATPDPAVVDVYQRDFPFREAFDGTWGFKGLPSPTGSPELDQEMERYRVRLEDGGRTFVATVPKANFGDAFLCMSHLVLDGLHGIYCHRKRHHELELIRADPKHRRIVALMEQGWRLRQTQGLPELIPPEGVDAKVRTIPHTMVLRLQSAGMVRKPHKEGPFPLLFNFDYELTEGPAPHDDTEPFAGFKP